MHLPILDRFSFLQLYMLLIALRITSFNLQLIPNNLAGKGMFILVLHVVQNIRPWPFLICHPMNE